MAIRPVDLQLAYMAAPQNAAVLSSAQEAPQAAAQAAQAAFAAEVTKREENVAQTVKVEGAKVRAREDRERSQQQASEEEDGREFAGDEQEPGDESPLGLAGGGHHFIDVTA